MELALLPPAVELGFAATLGLTIGSFLNAAIYRLPHPDLTLRKPRRSLCPSCGHGLAWIDNIPVVSWVLLRGRCRYCQATISARYPLIELLTAGLFVLTQLLTHKGDYDLLLVRWLVLAGLIVATFVDFDCFEIPDEVSIGGMFAAPLCSFLVPDLQRDTWLAQELSRGQGVDRVGALGASLAGLLVGGGVLYAIGRLGKRIYGREAMGFGDVKLLAAGGGFVGPGGALVALMIGSCLASLAGLGNLLRFAWLSWARARARGGQRGWAKALATGRIAGRYLPFGPYLGIGVGIVLLAWNHVARALP